MEIGLLFQLSTNVHLPIGRVDLDLVRCDSRAKGHLGEVQLLSHFSVAEVIVTYGQGGKRNVLLRRQVVSCGRRMLGVAHDLISKKGESMYCVPSCMHC